MDNKLTNIHGLASELKLPLRWLKGEADAGHIPCLRIGRKRLFNITAVRNTLAEMAKCSGDNTNE